MKLQSTRVTDLTSRMGGKQFYGLTERSASKWTAILFTFALYPSLVRGDGFLKHDPRANRFVTGNEADFREAMASALGCGGADDVDSHLADVQQELESMWRVLPKDASGQVEWRSMRYMAHRYFLKKSSLLLRGLEPARQVNHSDAGNAQILKDQVPSLVETVLEGKRSSNGYSLADASILVATMDRLIYDSESILLRTVYQYARKDPNQLLRHAELLDIIEYYLVYWMLQGDEEVVHILLGNRSLLESEIPHWASISHFANGMIKSKEFSRLKAGNKFGHGKMLMDGMYSFDEAHDVVAEITNTFASYWEAECQSIKTSLVAMDKTGTGRVSLSDFYGANADGEWRFGESQVYLRELGALDETRWGGKQVIIPNYIQGASNCIVTSNHYFVCCQNECEVIMNEIEKGVGEPVALPDQVLRPLVNFTGLDDEAPKITKKLEAQLQRIAETHGGKVPLHGRLFAQWLHYVFPQQCPFPHKVGTSSFTSPTEYGESFVASNAEVQTHAAKRNASDSPVQLVSEERLMAQWSEDEELIADYSLELRAPWESSRVGLVTLVALALLLLGRGAFAKAGNSSKAGGLGGMIPEQKTHFV